MEIVVNAGIGTFGLLIGIVIGRIWEGREWACRGDKGDTLQWKGNWYYIRRTPEPL